MLEPKEFSKILDKVLNKRISQLREGKKIIPCDSVKIPDELYDFKRLCNSTTDLLELYIDLTVPYINALVIKARIDPVDYPEDDENTLVPYLEMVLGKKLEGIVEYEFNLPLPTEFNMKTLHYTPPDIAFRPYADKDKVHVRLKIDNKLIFLDDIISISLTHTNDEFSPLESPYSDAKDIKIEPAACSAVDHYLEYLQFAKEIFCDKDLSKLPARHRKTIEQYSGCIAVPHGATRLLSYDQNEHLLNGFAAQPVKDENGRERFILYEFIDMPITPSFKPELRGTTSETELAMCAAYALGKKYCPSDAYQIYKRECLREISLLLKRWIYSLFIPYPNAKIKCYVDEDSIISRLHTERLENQQTQYDLTERLFEVQLGC
ncbi:hypothetical protein AUJ69_00345 [Candidatus Woesearchaeota archaeon CG1_02_47_18]|nr:MAG: hypothetical protein AUJ69_00345 [Candidatus Woesearchaeota archaeon CG1_02_47_18]HII29910.1 hypothetical protein [Candidatus Woesearchaeota archaeon]